MLLKVWFLSIGISVVGNDISAPTTNLVDGQCVENYDPNVHDGIDFFPEHSTDRRVKRTPFSRLEFRGKVKADYSLHWDVTYHNTYKLLTNKIRDETYVLWQCGTPKPEIDGAAGYFEVPVQRIGITSTTYMPYVEIIGERQALKYYTSSFSYVSSPCLRRLYQDGKIEEAYDPATWSSTIEEDDVDLVIADEWTADSNPKSFSITDTYEDTVFQVAEYVEVVGLFFNREHEATLALDYILSAYSCLRDEIQTNDVTKGGQNKKKVVIASYISSVGAFGITSCPNWYCDIVEDAGGELVLFEEEGEIETSWGSQLMSFDQVVAHAKNAHVYVADGPLPDDIADALLESLTIPIFDNQGSLGHNDWLERRLAEPDAVLADYVAMLWPEKYPDANRNFFRNISAGEEPGSKVSDDALEAACPNVNAPYFFLISAASDCLDRRSVTSRTSSNKKSTKKNVALVVGLAVALAVVVIAAFAMIFSNYLRKRRLQRQFEDTKNPTFVELTSSEEKDELNHKKDPNMA
mmetsp:Transcript_2941/g.4597  ORF Transcript_2941/g.4597 Transcript_2941/m.4597 type:complete len:521 (-) Transcript_2941:213-1775(-)